MKLVKMTDIEYFALNAISASAIKDYLISPKLYYKNHVLKESSEPTDEMLLGKAFHACILEPEVFKNYTVKTSDYDLRTKLGKENYAKLTDEQKQFLIKEDSYKLIMNMKESLLSDSSIKELFEQTFLNEFACVNDYKDVQIKSKFDMINDDLIVDLKTCADIDKVHYEYKNFLIQAVFYLMNSFFTDAKKRDFVFICIEKKYSHRIKLVKFSLKNEDQYNLFSLIESIINQVIDSIKEANDNKIYNNVLQVEDLNITDYEIITL